ncbi:MAG: response regulator [Ardenticatenaceae bacterium]|nr:response regulator [Anaerolineales bacterium]MCB9007762.1 response regulator [Ardenticatenaceae bacterium]
MPEQTTHQLRILLVEDDENAYDPIIRWLKEEHYLVRLATSYTEAKSALETDHFHLAIIDLKLTEEDPEDPEHMEGLLLLEDIEHLQLRGVMPTIVITAHQKYTLQAWNLKADRLVIKEAGYLSKLLNTIKELEEEKIRINFGLDYVSDSLNVLEEVAEDVNWSMAERPSTKLLTPQVRDLFGKLFVDARSLFVSKLTPGLTGAAIVQVKPTWQEGVGRSYVAKVGRKDKVETERRHYKANVERFLTGNSVAQADVRYSRHLGTLLYNFAESQGVALKEFDEFYRRSEPNQIVASLRELFEQTYHYWFDNPERVLADVRQLYYEAFQLDRKKLIGRIQIVLPELDPEAEMIQLTPGKEKVLNPIAWLDKYHVECVIQVHKCITHGDLTGRNIMVDESGKCWLIDFYRTYKSHILRDFVILETDVKYRLMSLLSLTDFLHLEEALLEADRQNQPPILPPSFSKDARKAAEIVFALRQMAHRYARSFNTQQNEARKEYLLSQLMGTLNVVRLRHISENRKLQAMHSAVMLCEELDLLAGRPSSSHLIDMYREPVPVSQATFAEDSSFFAPALLLASAQQRFLAENVVKDNVILFIGSAIPRNADWPNNNQLAQQLMKEVDISASPTDKPTKLFAFYINRMGNRKRLIQKHIEYYSSSKRPSIYRAAAKLPWRTVYTTNQHTYLEQAYQNRGVMFTTQLHANGKDFSQKNDPIFIHKLFGTINAKDEETGPDCLPITEYDHRQHKTINRVTQLWQQLATAVQKGAFLLMLCPSEDELMAAYQHCQPDSATGLIWLAGGDISEEEQDVYRNLDFRVLPEPPGQLLKVLFTLTNYDGEDIPGLTKE